MRQVIAFILLVLLAATPAAGADAPLLGKPNERPIPAKDAAKAMTVPQGFKVTLFAGEPDVVQPIAMTFDDRGQLWVVECLSYPNWKKDGTGNDRVVILEDTDGDGQFDKRTVFLDNGVNLSGIEVGFGGVWLCSSPNLVFVPVKDGEDKPAGPAEVVLDGWNIKDTKHNVYNSLAWGPDGWLYGCNGIQAKAKVGKPGAADKDRVALDCGVWRYHPTRKVFELYASGTTNPWGLDWDDHGQMFITNCVIHHVWHVVPGGHMQRMYGEDINPYTYGLMTSCADHLHWGGGPWTSSRTTGIGGKPEHSEAGGGHAHSGCMVYLGDNFPAEYRDGIFMCNIHGNRLNRDTPERNKAGYAVKHAPDFLFANDSWFRGLAVKYGPDGGVYVADWSDTGECHNYDKVDLTNGRVFKVVYGTPKPWKGDIAKLTDAELIKLQMHANEWMVRHARRVLQERAAAGKLAKATVEELRRLVKMTEDVRWKLRLVWALHAVGGLTDADLAPLLGHADENIRLWAVMLAAEPKEPTKTATDGLVRLAAQEESEFVLVFLAGAIQRLPAKEATALAKALVGRVVPEDDPNLALMCWYAVESVLTRNPAADWKELLALVRHPLVARNTTRYLLASIPPEKRSARLGELVAYLADAVLAEKQLPVLIGMQDALATLREFPEPAGWNALYPDLANSDTPEVRTRAESLAVLFGNPKAIATLKARITDKQSDASARTSAIELLTRRKADGLAPILQSVLTDPTIRGAAVRALAAFPDDTTPEKILAAYPTFTAAEKADAVQTLTARPAFATALLDAVEKGTVARADVSVVAARQVIAFSDKTLTERLGKVWGTIRPAAQDRTAAIKKWKGVLTADAIQTADKTKGRALYVQHCAACHKLFGEGGDTAPDLTGSQRANLDYVLENVLDPSAVVPREFQVTNFTLTDGRLVSGIILRETPDGVTVRTVNDTVVVAKGDIEARKPTTQSLMPEGLFDKLKPEEVRDLVAYLGSPQQVPLSEPPKK